MNLFDPILTVFDQWFDPGWPLIRTFRLHSTVLLMILPSLTYVLTFLTAGPSFDRLRAAQKPELFDYFGRIRSQAPQLGQSHT